jgi:hypothetical protein
MYRAKCQVQRRLAYDVISTSFTSSTVKYLHETYMKAPKKNAYKKNEKNTGCVHREIIDIQHQSDTCPVQRPQRRTALFISFYDPRVAQVWVKLLHAACTHMFMYVCNVHIICIYFLIIVFLIHTQKAT